MKIMVVTCSPSLAVDEIEDVQASTFYNVLLESRVKKEPHLCIIGALFIFIIELSSLKRQLMLSPAVRGRNTY